MVRMLFLAALGAAFLVPRPALAAHTPTWAKCFRHLDWATETHVLSVDCTRYPMPKHTGERVTGHVKTCVRLFPHVIRCVRFPQFPALPAPAPVVTQPTGTTRPMLVTYYLATGNPMANGQYPYIGAAACGADLALGVRVSVPGIGTLTCTDRIGYDPWNHIDVYGIPLASGYRLVTVLG